MSLSLYGIAEDQIMIYEVLSTLRFAIRQNLRIIMNMIHVT